MLHDRLQGVKGRLQSYSSANLRDVSGPRKSDFLFPSFLCFNCDCFVIYNNGEAISADWLSVDCGSITGKITHPGMNCKTILICSTCNKRNGENEQSRLHLRKKYC